jgi:hypothetical protein
MVISMTQLIQPPNGPALQRAVLQAAEYQNMRDCPEGGDERGRVGCKCELGGG